MKKNTQETQIISHSIFWSMLIAICVMASGCGQHSDASKELAKIEQQIAADQAELEERLEAMSKFRAETDEIIAEAKAQAEEAKRIGEEAQKQTEELQIKSQAQAPNHDQQTN